jgi:inorganic phosphate transporter, PiT family
MMEAMLLMAALLLAYSNGANDNFKGFATVWGSGTANYDKAVLWATITTIAGAVVSLYLAQGLVDNFSGRGLVPKELAGTTSFVLSVSLGAGLTVLLATVLGFPVSTTHSIIGGLVGAGLAAPGHDVNFGKLGQTFLLPLLASPFLSAIAALALFAALRRLLGSSVAAEEFCVCEVPLNGPQAVSAAGGTVASLAATSQTMIGTEKACAPVRTAVLAKGSLAGLIDKLHYLSAASICFARGLNDTPKLVALLLAAKYTGTAATFWLVALAMATGGWLSARKVAVTMSRKIVQLSPAQGFAANIVTALLVIFASKLGLPVSTTHVSVGSISGVGVVTRTTDWGALSKIVLSWVVTLPLAGLIGAIAMLLAR